MHGERMCSRLLAPKRATLATSHCKEMSCLRMVGAGRFERPMCGVMIEVAIISGGIGRISMFSDTVDIKPLDGTAVFCQGEGCDQPALYLFCTSTRPTAYAAYCEHHARQCANR